MEDGLIGACLIKVDDFTYVLTGGMNGDGTRMVNHFAG